VAVGMANWVRVPAKPAPAAPTPAPDSDDEPAVPRGMDWESVLYFGPGTEAPAQGVERTSVSGAPGPRRGDTRSRHREEGSS